MAQSKYTPEEQIDYIAADLLSDIEHAERQANEGPHFLELGITADSLRAYAVDCRAQLARLKARNGSPTATVNAFVAGKL